MGVEWRRAKEEGVGDQVARPGPETPTPQGGIVHVPLPGQKRNLEVGDIWDVLGRGAWRPVLGPICPPSLLPPLVSGF